MQHPDSSVLGRYSRSFPVLRLQRPCRSCKLRIYSSPQREGHRGWGNPLWKIHSKNSHPRKRARDTSLWQDGESGEALPDPSLLPVGLRAAPHKTPACSSAVPLVQAEAPAAEQPGPARKAELHPQRPARNRGLTNTGKYRTYCH